MDGSLARDCCRSRAFFRSFLACPCRFWTLQAQGTPHISPSRVLRGAICTFKTWNCLRLWHVAKSPCTGPAKTSGWTNMTFTRQVQRFVLLKSLLTSLNARLAWPISHADMETRDLSREPRGRRGTSIRKLHCTGKARHHVQPSTL